MLSVPRHLALAALLVVSAGVALLPPTVDSLPVDTGMGPEVHHAWPYLTADLAALSALHPEISRWYSMGKSHAGLDLWVLEVANFAQPGAPRPVVVFDGGHHGNEPLGMEAVYAVAVRLLNEYEEDPAVRALVDGVHLYLVPSVNPDGNLLNQRKNLEGVDLNRNYPWRWGEPGCSHNPNSATYCGPSAASEPEVQAMVTFLTAVDPDVYVSMHTGTTAFLHSWGYTAARPPDDGLYRAIGAAFRAETGIRADQASTGLYVTSGSSKDWVYGTTGGLSWTFEVHNEQNIPVSFQDIEARIAPALRGLYWILAEADRFGARVAPGDLAFGAGPPGAAVVRVPLANDGLGPTVATARLDPGDAPLALAGPAEVAVAIPAGTVGWASFTVVPGPDGAGEAIVEVAYPRTAHLGETASAARSYAVTAAGGALRSGAGG